MKKRRSILMIIGQICFLGIFILVGYIFLNRDSEVRWQIMNYLPWLTVAGAVFTVVGALMSLIKSNWSSKKLGQSGVFAMGNLISVGQTGMLVNHQPQLALTVEINLPDGETQVSEILAIIPLQELAYFQPGAVIPVRYNQNKPEEMVLDFKQNPEEMQKAVNQDLIQKGVLSQETLDIVEKGARGKAVVLAIAPTGELVNGNPEVTFTLSVTPENGERYESIQTKVLLPETATKLVVGSVVDIAYLKESRDKIAFLTKFG